MAHLEALPHVCSRASCRFAPQFALYDRHKAIVGRFCKRHALAELGRLQATEDAERKRRNASLPGQSLADGGELHKSG
jgi:hypothetical protein